MNQKTQLLKKKSRRVRASAYVSYFAIAALIISVVSLGYQAPVQKDASANSLSRAAAVDTAPSIDQLAAAELAATAAETAALAVANNVTSLSISLSAKSELAQSNSNLLNKPQIVEVVDSRDVKEYKAVSGDTVAKVANKFGLTQDTIRWANNLTSNTLSVGQTLKIPSTNGVIYVVKSGDTAESLAEKYKTSKSRIITYNDAELTGLKVGQQIVIPGGVLPEYERPGYTAPTNNYYSSYSYYSNAGAVAGNRYAYGNCTYYVYNRRAEIGRPVGSFWGNANTWKYYAAAAGYTVDGTPRVGAVLTDQWSAPPYGHVAVVEAVYANGGIRVSEMNYAGFDVISYRDISAGEITTGVNQGQYRFIH